MRYAFFFLIFMMLFPMPILIWALDVEKGRRDAERYALERGTGGAVHDDGEAERLINGNNADTDS